MSTGRDSNACFALDKECCFEIRDCDFAFSIRGKWILIF